MTPPDPAKVIPAPCPSCGEWRKSGMIHNCGNNPAKVIAETLRGWLPVALADRALAQDLAEAVLAALAAAGFPVGGSRDVEAIVEGLRRWGDYSLVGVPLDVAVAAVREAAQPDTVRNGVCLLCGSGVLLSGEHIRNEDCPAARPVPAPDNPDAPPIPWGRVRELLLGDETVDKAAHSLFDGVAAIERSATYAALAAAVDHAEKEEKP